jgi:hypothetical protein
MVIWESAIWVAEELDHLYTESTKNVRPDHAAYAVPSVYDNLELARSHVRLRILDQLVNV